MAALTDPEARTERALGWKAVARVKAKAGCFCCLHRGAELFDRALCGLHPEQSFPACVMSGHFAPDHQRIYSQENVE